MKIKHPFIYSIKTLLGLAILTCWHLHAAAQTPRIDSIKSFLKTTKQDTSKVNTLIALTGAFLLEAKDYQSFNECNEEQLELSRKLGFKKGIAYGVLNKALYAESKGDYATALDFNFKALTLMKDMADMPGEGSCYTHISNIYLKLNKIDDALTYQLKSLTLSKTMNDKRAMLTAYHDLGKTYEYKKKYAEAIRYYNMALDTAKGMNMQPDMLDYFMGLSSAYQGMGNFETALQYLDRYYIEKDSLLSKESVEQLAELNKRYETDKKGKEILLLTKDQELNAKIIRQQQLQRWGLIGGLALLSLSIGSIYKRYHSKKKANTLLEKQKEEIQQKNLFITDSIDYAKTIQEAVLPSAQRVNDLLQDAFILYKPKAIVSGDFYWLTSLNERLICAVADCTGHGVPGAFMSLLGYNMLENAAKNAIETNPAFILDALNADVKSRLTAGSETSKHGMDISLISIHRKTNMLEFAGAHNSIYIIRGAELIELKADKIGIGEIKQFKSFNKQEFELQKGDTIYLFTDGFPDQIGGPKRKKFYYQPFKDLLLSICNMPMTEQKIKLDEVHVQWMGEKMDQTDDVLIIGMRYN